MADDGARGREPNHRVVIVGGGFGGLAAIDALKGSGVDITLIDRRNHHLFQPLLYQVATAALATSEIAWPTRHIMRRRDDVRTLMATATGIDTVARQVRLEDDSTVPYDSLIVATGASHAYFGNDAWEEHAPGLKTLEDAIAIRRRVLLAYEAAERETDPEQKRALQTFVVVGGGPTGVEMAGAIVELGRTSLRGEYRSLDVQKTRVVVIEGGERVLPTFRKDLSDYALKAMHRLGIEVELGENVTAIDAEGVTYGEKRIAARTVIWGAGTEASPAGKWLSAETDKAGRVKVTETLTLPGHDEVYVIGDTAAIEDAEGEPVPAVADGAKQSGRHAANAIRARRAGRPVEPFLYRHKGSLATIGKRAAVVDLGWIRLTGFIAWLMWGVAHIYFLIDTRNRFSVAASWLFIYLTGQRSARLITQGAAETKTPLEEIEDPSEALAELDPSRKKEHAR